jgi:hypothetical protein
LVEYLGSFFKDEDFCGGTSNGGASNGDATLFCQTRLGFEFNFGLTGSSFLTCSSSLFNFFVVEDGDILSAS